MYTKEEKVMISLGIIPEGSTLGPPLTAEKYKYEGGRWIALEFSSYPITSVTAGYDYLTFTFFTQFKKGGE